MRRISLLLYAVLSNLVACASDSIKNALGAVEPFCRELGGNLSSGAWTW